MQDMSLDTMFKVISQIAPPNTSIAVADNRQFVYYQPSETINLNIRPGDQIHQQTTTYQALEKRQKYANFVDRDVFGTPYYGISFPIMTEGEPKGCITSIVPVKDLSFKHPLLTIRGDDRWFPVAFDKVIYLASEQRKTFVQGTDIFGYHQGTLRQLDMLLPDNFIRTHRSYLININHITEIHPDSHSTFMLKMTGDYKVPVSQTYASQFRTLLNF